MDERISIAAAKPEDLGEIKALLTALDLPTAGVDEHWRTFIVARDGGVLVACGGAEVHPEVALIRSIAVRKDYQKHGVGRQIVRQLIDRLASHGVRDFYLLTTTAEEYFVRRGFKKIERSQMHPQLADSAELRGACPDSAVCMRLLMM